MTRYLLLLPVLFFMIGCSTSFNVKRNENGGDSSIDYTYLCPSYAFSEGSRVRPYLSDATNHISQAGPEGKIAIDKAKQYVKDYAGDAFMAKTSLCFLTVTYKDSVDIFRKKRLSPYSASKCGDIKYCVYLRFTPQMESSYDIAVPMDEKFELLEPLHIPDKEKNPGFYTVIPREKAYKIARKKYASLLKHAESISLQYDDNLNSFIWEVEGEKKDIENYEVEYWIIKVNANSGRIVGTQMKIASGHNSRFF